MVLLVRERENNWWMKNRLVIQQVDDAKMYFGTENDVIDLVNRYTPPDVPPSMAQYEASVNQATTETPAGVTKDSQLPTGVQKKPVPLFKSNYRCMRHVQSNTVIERGRNITTEPNERPILFTSCQFENLCLNRRGEWILFKDMKEREQVDGKVWVFAAPIDSKNFEPAKIRIHVKSPPLFIDEQKGHDNSDRYVKLATNFKWVSIPTFGYFRHAAGNIGHILMDNLMTLFNNMVNFEYVNMNNVLLFLDDVFNKETGLHSKGRMNANVGERTSMSMARFISKHAPLQMCYNNRRGYYIHNAPCRQEERDDTFQLTPTEGNEIETCFSSITMGSPESYYFDIHGREVIIPLFRNFMMRRLNMMTRNKYDKEYFTRKKTLTIAIHNKVSGHHTDSIINQDKIAQYLRVRENEILSKVNAERQTSYEHVKVVNLVLEDLTFMEQLEFFSSLDVYITTQGSASYMAMFMLNPNSIMIYPPLCYADTLQCTDFNIRFHVTFTNVKTVSLMNRLDMIECVRDNRYSGKGFEVSKAPVVRYPFGTCPLRIDPVKMYEVVLSELLEISR